ncbi:MAG: hypothetical protein H0V62_09645 [Gammaproteobacteria bacterium]|nr:hypothetical protein [Gammaproteobacteria bacterium]
MNELEWYSGIAILTHMFEQFAEPADIPDSFLALFAVGMVLALVRAGMGHIAACIGLHAGGVLVIKLTKDITYADPAATDAFLVGTYDSVIGYLALILIATLAFFYHALALRNGAARQETR